MPKNRHDGFLKKQPRIKDAPLRERRWHSELRVDTERAIRKSNRQYRDARLAWCDLPRPIREKPLPKRVQRWLAKEQAEIDRENHERFPREPEMEP